MVSLAWEAAMASMCVSVHRLRQSCDSFHSAIRHLASVYSHPLLHHSCPPCFSARSQQHSGVAPVENARGAPHLLIPFHSASAFPTPISAQRATVRPTGRAVNPSSCWLPVSHNPSGLERAGCHSFPSLDYNSMNQPSEPGSWYA